MSEALPQPHPHDVGVDPGAPLVDLGWCVERVEVEAKYRGEQLMVEWCVCVHACAFGVRVAVSVSKIPSKNTHNHKKTLRRALPLFQC